MLEARDFRSALLEMACRLRLDFLGVKIGVAAASSSSVMEVPPWPKEILEDFFFLVLEEDRERERVSGLGPVEGLSRLGISHLSGAKCQNRSTNSTGC